MELNASAGCALIIRKDGTKEPFNPEKIKRAIQKSAARVKDNIITEDEQERVCQLVAAGLPKDKAVTVPEIHHLVEAALDEVRPDVAKSYRDYRNYKHDFVYMMDDILTESQKIRYIGDKDNANCDSALVSTKRSLIYKKFSKETYKKFFLHPEEKKANDEGYIYIHDLGDRSECPFNCCLFDAKEVLSRNFTMSNVVYKKPKRLRSMIGVLCDVTLNASANQYGGFTITEVDKLIAPYAEVTYNEYIEEYKNIAGDLLAEYKPEEVLLRATEYADKKIKKDLQQAFQEIEYKFNTVASARGDFSFITFTFGLGTSKFEKLVSKTMMEVRRAGQGEPAVPVLFPKLVFLYTKDLHGEGKECADVFDAAVECTNSCMYPDYLSLDNGYLGDVYKKYGVPISPMGKGLTRQPI